ncbi:MAG: 4-(cytidine 5'-diphospho)-2-C-methyl-D-erythritol kinase [Ferruginibacter sp.]
MLSFPNCKINLGLKITGKRQDGYHNIETVFYPVQLNDALEIIHSTAQGHPPEVLFSHSGAVIPGEEKDNLCIKAYHLLKKDFPQLPSVKIHLHKAIPMGAGLGGGSADAAFTLVTLNRKYELNLSTDQLLSYALELGSDCPFFIINEPCLATGRGEILHSIKVVLSGYRLILVNPGIHINTSWAFSQLKPVTGQLSGSVGTPELIQTIIFKPITYWKEGLINEFETPVCEKYPEIRKIKENLYENGALYASLSGSGSSVYGIFENNSQSSFDFPENYLVKSIIL